MSRLTSINYLKKVMSRYYTGLRIPSPGKRIAWVTSGAPVEILRAMNIQVAYPENYAALCAARRQSQRLIEIAESSGLSGDLCSYARCHIGSVLSPNAAPWKGLPRPAVLICCNNICSTVTLWYEYLADILKVPLFFIDTPRVDGAPASHQVAYVKRQLEDLVCFLEARFGRRLDEQVLKATLRTSAQTAKLWANIRSTAMKRPSPIEAPDLFIAMAPIVVLRGTRAALDFYQLLHKELLVRIDNGVGIGRYERVRLVWDNIAIWHALFRVNQMFAAHGGVFVADTYTGGWTFELMEGDPLESMAHAYLSVFLNKGFADRLADLEKTLSEYGADGLVMHANRSCKPYSLIQPELAREISRRLGLPVLLLECDMADPRAYAEEQLRLRIEAFMEQLWGIL